MRIVWTSPTSHMRIVWPMSTSLSNIAVRWSESKLSWSEADKVFLEDVVGAAKKNWKSFVTQQLTLQKLQTQKRLYWHMLLTCTDVGSRSAGTKKMTNWTRKLLLSVMMVVVRLWLRGWKLHRDERKGKRCRWNQKRKTRNAKRMKLPKRSTVYRLWLHYPQLFFFIFFFLFFF